jgi:hypothetical protein
VVLDWRLRLLKLLLRLLQLLLGSACDEERDAAAGVLQQRDGLLVADARR